MARQLRCEVCEEYFSHFRALHWHLQMAHDFTSEEAYDATRQAADEDAQPQIDRAQYFDGIFGGGQ